MSISSEPASPVAWSAGILQTMRIHPLVSFFVLAYAVRWVLWSPVLYFGLPPFSPATHAPSWYILPGGAEAAK
jgi:uncharacterized protein